MGKTRNSDVPDGKWNTFSRRRKLINCVKSCYITYSEKPIGFGNLGLIGEVTQTKASLEWIQERIGKKLDPEEFFYKMWRLKGNLRKKIFFVVWVERYRSRYLTQPRGCNRLLAEVFGIGSLRTYDTVQLYVSREGSHRQAMGRIKRFLGQAHVERNSWKEKHWWEKATWHS